MECKIINEVLLRNVAKLSKLDDNMQVKGCHGLYIIGESVNVNGICGGYNLQWAWTSAALAAESISQDV